MAGHLCRPPDSELRTLHRRTVNGALASKPQNIVQCPENTDQLPAMKRRGLICVALVLVFGCQAVFAASIGVLESVRVEVPGVWRYGPFDRNRMLNVPAGAKISVLARVREARFLAVSPEGAILVSQPGRGKISVIKVSGWAQPAISDLISGLRLPHGMVFERIGEKLYLYVSESNQISRFVYLEGQALKASQEIVLANLPDRSSSNLGGIYGHELKNIAIGPDRKLYVDIASASNANPADTKSNPLRSAIYRCDLDGRNLQLFARGIRNAEGLAFVPGTNVLWAVVNERDNIRYPFRNGWRGSRESDYGRVLPSYVDDHPPDEFIEVKEGANYGWPFANPNPDHGLTDMSFDPDFENNPDWSRFPPDTFRRIDRGIQAHSAPLGLSFLQNSKVPLPFRNAAVTALHGSWNRRRKTGYKVVIFPWLSNGKPGQQADLVSGWLDDETQRVWGRPVDVVPDLDGNLLISDDASGTIYRLSFARGSE
jgi:glucose/arabinose dehydrogenase